MADIISTMTAEEDQGENPMIEEMITMATDTTEMTGTYVVASRSQA